MGRSELATLISAYNSCRSRLRSVLMFGKPGSTTAPRDRRARKEAWERQERARAPKVPEPRLAEQSVEVLHHLDHIRSRLPTILALEKELQAIDGRCLNDVVLRMAIDSIDMLVIDLVSLCKSVINPKGLLNQLRHHLHLLRDVNPDDLLMNLRPAAPGALDGKLMDSLRRQVQREDARHQNAVRRRLLPACEGREVTVDDVEGLITRFKDTIEPICRDRDRARAHRYEEKTKRIQDAYLTPLKIEATIEGLVQYFKDVHLVVTGNGFAAVERGLGQHPTTAQDIADIITTGSINQACYLYEVTPKHPVPGQEQPFYWAKRKAYMQKLRSEGKEPTDA